MWRLKSSKFEFSSAKWLNDADINPSLTEGPWWITELTLTVPHKSNNQITETECSGKRDGMLWRWARRMDSQAKVPCSKILRTRTSTIERCRNWKLNERVTRSGSKLLGLARSVRKSSHCFIQFFYVLYLSLTHSIKQTYYSIGILKRYCTWLRSGMWSICFTASSWPTFVWTNRNFSRSYTLKIKTTRHVQWSKLAFLFKNILFKNIGGVTNRISFSTPATIELLTRSRQTQWTMPPADNVWLQSFSFDPD